MNIRLHAVPKKVESRVSPRVASTFQGQRPLPASRGTVIMVDDYSRFEVAKSLRYCTTFNFTVSMFASCLVLYLYSFLNINNSTGKYLNY